MAFMMLRMIDITGNARMEPMNLARYQDDTFMLVVGPEDNERYVPQPNRWKYDGLFMDAFEARKDVKILLKTKKCVNSNYDCDHNRNTLYIFEYAGEPSKENGG